MGAAGRGASHLDSQPPTAAWASHMASQHSLAKVCLQETLCLAFLSMWE